MEEKFNLKVKDFHQKTATYFSRLKDDEDQLSDITLVSDDEIHIPAHKVILSVSSQFFSDLIRKFKERNPLIYLGGIMSRDLQNILSYIYNGQVQVGHQELDTFLQVAKKLKVDGLNQSIRSEDLELEEEEVQRPALTRAEYDIDNYTVNNIVINNPTNIKTVDTEIIANILRNHVQIKNQSKMIASSEERSNPGPKQQQPKKQSVIDVGIEDLFVKAVDGFVCKKCGEIFDDESKIELHFESHWGDLACKKCGKVYGGSESPSNHKHVYTFFNKFL